MASQDSATPSLDPSIPRIPSPSGQIPPTALLAEKAVNGVPLAQTAEKAPLATEQSSALSDSTGEFSPALNCDPFVVPVEKASEAAVAVPLPSEQSSELSDSTGEFNPASDCDQCEVPVPDPVVEIRVDIEDEERSTPDTEIDDLSNSRCCPQCRGFSRVYYTLSELTDTEYAIPLWLLLMALPISAGFMGARYLDDCKFSPTTPPLMFLMGMSGMVMITTRIVIIVHRATWEQAVGRKCLNTTLVITYVLTLLIFCTELMTFWRYTPSFDQSSPNYCNPTFYTYAFWINCTTIFVSILMFIIRIPTCLFVR